MGQREEGRSFRSLRDNCGELCLKERNVVKGSWVLEVWFRVFACFPVIFGYNGEDYSEFYFSNLTRPIHLHQ